MCPGWQLTTFHEASRMLLLLLVEPAGNPSQTREARQARCRGLRLARAAACDSSSCPSHSQTLAPVSPSDHLRSTLPTICLQPAYADQPARDEVRK